MSEPAVEVTVLSGSDPRRSRCHVIRHTVFIVEQSVPESIEVDGRDASSTHFLATVAGVDVGTARMRLIDSNGRRVAKAERVAVLAEYRAHGVGRALMDALEAAARNIGAVEVQLGAQMTASRFYRRLDYLPLGPRYHEAGIEHQMMRKALYRVD